MFVLASPVDVFTPTITSYMKHSTFRSTLLGATAALALTVPAALNAQTLDRYLIHSSSLVLVPGAEGGNAVLAEPASASAFHFIPDGQGCYSIENADHTGFLALNGKWNTTFIADSSSNNAKFYIEKAQGSYSKLRCKSNSKYLGTDANTVGASAFCDKSGTDMRHYWLLGETAFDEPAVDTVQFVVNAAAKAQPFEGWGVSLCWWANVAGHWSEEKVDELVDWLVSPTGLNYNLFRYNIGGGDDPNNANCTAHHMGKGKGLRAEMEGFKDSTNCDYIWTRDEAQRRIMLKIKEKRPDAVFEAFSNSAPYYMTYSGCCSGNTTSSKDNLKPEYYEEFAHYLVDVCKHYKDVYGIEFRTLDPFNEPMTSYWGANGGQEGCHFDVASQVAFLKVLSPILKESGLSTVISASDETSVAQSVTDFNSYTSNGVIDLVGQWNVHTYTADVKSRTQVGSLAAAKGMRLWMSETGSGGSGISGNLNMAQKLINDVRYLTPNAWIDWQYLEGNDQWGLVKGDISKITGGAEGAERTKNYYVRQQFSRFIKPGYTILNVLNEQTLAARNAAGDTLVVVSINPSAATTCMNVSLAGCTASGSGISAYVTNETSNAAALTDYKFADGVLTYTLNPLSAVTFVVPVSGVEPDGTPLTDGATYLISPRRTVTMAAAASGTNVVLADVDLSASQLWKAKAQTDGRYTFTSASGKVMNYASGYYVNASSDLTAATPFEVTSVGAPYYKVTEETSAKSFDLEGEGTKAGTKLGLWTYGTSPTVTHRQWSFVAVPEELIPAAIEQATALVGEKTFPFSVETSHGVISVSNLSNAASAPLAIYDASGRCVYRACSLKCGDVRVPVAEGVYLVASKRSVRKVVVE